MPHIKSILLILSLVCISMRAQTPYDSFSPATSRPILDVVQNLDAYNDSLQSSPMDAPFATQDDVSKWLSPDPLSDKYPEISPYSYCNWNPVKYIDPDGRDVTLAGANRSSVTIRTDLINLNVNISNLNVDFGGTYNFQGDEILSASLDIAGIFDPSGVADGLNAALQWDNGDVSGAVISAAGLFPYVGDLAKVGKVKKDIGVINNAIEAVNNNRDKVKFLQGTKGKEILREVPIPEGFKKMKQRSHGQPIYTDGKRYISPNRDGHNGGVWKMADSPDELRHRNTRSGTYDENLTRIGD